MMIVYNVLLNKKSEFSTISEYTKYNSQASSPLSLNISLSVSSPQNVSYFLPINKTSKKNKNNILYCTKSTCYTIYFYIYSTIYICVYLFKVNHILFLWKQSNMLSAYTKYIYMYIYINYLYVYIKKKNCTVASLSQGRFGVYPKFIWEEETAAPRLYRIYQSINRLFVNLWNEFSSFLQVLSSSASPSCRLDPKSSYIARTPATGRTAASAQPCSVVWQGTHTRK